ncbi:MAG: hypothetical protein ABEI39_00765 [Halobacteriales archaeon]
MDTLGDLATGTGDGTAVRVGDGRTYTRGEFAETATKASNFFRFHGARSGARVGIVTAPDPKPVLGVFGAALLGAPVDPDPGGEFDGALLLAPTAELEEYDPAPGCTRVAFGAEPDDPRIEYFERGVWSENPIAPDAGIEEDAAALVAGGETYTHARLLDAAGAVVASAGIEAGEAVALRAGMADPRALVAGVLAPLLAGATVVLAPATPADVGVGRDVPEARAIDPAEVPL